MLKLVQMQHAPSSGYKCKYIKTYDLNSQKHSMRVIQYITDLKNKETRKNEMIIIIIIRLPLENKDSLFFDVSFYNKK